MGKILLDVEMDYYVVDEICEVLVELLYMILIDLYVWKVGKGKFFCILVLEMMVDLIVDCVWVMFLIYEEIVYVLVEVNGKVLIVLCEILVSL